MLCYHVVVAGNLSIDDMVKCCSSVDDWNEYVTELMQDWGIPRKWLGRVERMHLTKEYEEWKADADE
jgi:hypothetical protein